jgi:hypothetical protein
MEDASQSADDPPSVEHDPLADVQLVNADLVEASVAAWVLALAERSERPQAGRLKANGAAVMGHGLQLR